MDMVVFGRWPNDPQEEKSARQKGNQFDDIDSDQKKMKNLMTLVTLIYVKNESHVDRIRGVVWTYK